MQFNVSFGLVLVVLCFLGVGMGYFLWFYFFIYISSITIVSSLSISQFFLPYGFSLLFWELGFPTASGSANWQKYMRKWDREDKRERDKR